MVRWIMVVGVIVVVLYTVNHVAFLKQSIG